jgi:acetyl-CoA synthetase
MKPGSCAFPYYGIDFAVVDPLVIIHYCLFYTQSQKCFKTGKELFGNDVEGVLCIKKPWPSIGQNFFILKICLFLT